MKNFEELMEYLEDDQLDKKEKKFITKLLKQYKDNLHVFFFGDEIKDFFKLEEKTTYKELKKYYLEKNILIKNQKEDNEEICENSKKSNLKKVNILKISKLGIFFEKRWDKLYNTLSKELVPQKKINFFRDIIKNQIAQQISCGAISYAVSECIYSYVFKKSKVNIKQVISDYLTTPIIYSNIEIQNFINKCKLKLKNIKKLKMMLL